MSQPLCTQSLTKKMTESFYKYGLGFGLGGQKINGHKVSIGHLSLSEDSYTVVKGDLNLDPKLMLE